MIFRASCLVLCLSHSLAKSLILILNNRRENQQRLALCAMLLSGVGFPGWLQSSGDRGWYRGAPQPDPDPCPHHIWLQGLHPVLMLAPTASNSAHVCTPKLCKVPREKTFDTENSHMSHLCIKKPNLLSVVLQCHAGSAAPGVRVTVLQDWGDRRVCGTLHLSMLMSFLLGMGNREMQPLLQVNSVTLVHWCVSNSAELRTLGKPENLFGNNQERRNVVFLKC